MNVDTRKKLENFTTPRVHHLSLFLPSSEPIGGLVPHSVPSPWSSHPAKSRDYHLQIWEIYTALGSDSPDR